MVSICSFNRRVFLIIYITFCKILSTRISCVDLLCYRWIDERKHIMTTSRQQISVFGLSFVQITLQTYVFWLFFVILFARLLHLMICLFVLRFYGPVNPLGSCRARSVYLTTRLLDRLSPVNG